MKYTKEIFEEVVAKAKNIADVVRNLGLKLSGSSHRYIKQRLEYFGINISHFQNVTGSNEFKEKLPYEIVLVQNRLKIRRETTKLLRRALVESGVKEQCVNCGLSQIWNGKFIRLQIDHKNGDGLDNRKDNLRFLCPNCHSQTENFGAKKHEQPKIRKGCKRPQKSVLEKMIFEIPTTIIAKNFGVSDKAVEKWCKFYHLSKPERGYWTKINKLK